MRELPYGRLVSLYKCYGRQPLRKEEWETDRQFKKLRKRVWKYNVEERGFEIRNAIRQGEFCIVPVETTNDCPLELVYKNSELVGLIRCGNVRLFEDKQYFENAEMEKRWWLQLAAYRPGEDSVTRLESFDDWRRERYEQSKKFEAEAKEKARRDNIVRTFCGESAWAIPWSWQGANALFPNRKRRYSKDDFRFKITNHKGYGVYCWYGKRMYFNVAKSLHDAFYCVVECAVKHGVPRHMVFQKNEETERDPLPSSMSKRQNILQLRALGFAI